MEFEKGGNIFPHQLIFPLAWSHVVIIVSDLVTIGLYVLYENGKRREICGFIPVCLK